ncbi:TetR family transcriptional regulator [Gordonia amarae]|uniref:TetR family transcriptional regulator n=1 Tax=Gordonia amarae TaxID=36821 RepID=A0A857MJT8_9ACTN|nr:TetR family transcriptional regulator [Gordonia amarae]QHN24322.1 TetR family transcriptional regulator [Gordonia amarae]QHN33245.1 TetR family transcriptional regulator [Gordonia amarae]QHN41965.1 TetR family transcriptional regulator [Gordonia amarae]
MRRQRILAVASDMLEEMPVAQVSLNELSRRVGLAKSNVLRYFESREAILLQLLDAELHQWAAQVDAMLVETPADRAERIAQVADLMAESIAARPVLCDLISAQSAVLERNISTEVAMQHKYAIGGEVQTVVRAMVRAVPELSEAQAWQVLAYTILLTAGAWPQSRPAPAIQAAYDLYPQLAAGQMDFTDTVRDLIRITITGLLASA